jgi:hypothetical protein
MVMTVSSIEDRRLACACRVFAAQKCFLPFNVKGKCWVKPATLKAMQEAERTFAEDDCDRAEHLAAVVICMMKRDTAKFTADPKAWMARMRFVAELAHQQDFIDRPFA